MVSKEDCKLPSNAPPCPHFENGVQVYDYAHSN